MFSNLKLNFLLLKDCKKAVINTSEEYTSQKFRLKNKEEIKNYFFKKIEQNELISNKHKNVLQF